MQAEQFERNRIQHGKDETDRALATQEADCRCQSSTDMATLTACAGSCPTAPPLASPRPIVAQSHSKNTKSRRSKRPLLNRASTYVPPSWQNGSRWRFAPSQPHLSPWPNPHSTRGTAAARIPRFRALALLGRRLPEREDNPAIPVSENLHKPGLDSVTWRGGAKLAGSIYQYRA